MNKYLVTRVIKYSRIVEADSKEEAIALMYDVDAAETMVKESAKLIKEEFDVGVPPLRKSQ